MDRLEERSTSHLEIIESHKTMIERDSSEISGNWRAITIFLHFVCAISGYASSTLFYIFWHDIFGLNCPIWARLEPPIHIRWLKEMGTEVIEEEGPEFPNDDWRKKLIIEFKHDFHCQFFFCMCLCSCSFGIIWLMMFWRCGKGGYDTRVFTAPWRIIPPALIFHLIVAPIVIGVVHNFVYGYWSFTKNLKTVAATYMNATEMAKFERYRRYFNLKSFPLSYSRFPDTVKLFPIIWKYTTSTDIMCVMFTLQSRYSRG
uniref:Ighg1 protein n=1 Tax=Fopius arisanus TaxID=64838 RepID=A0A0C9PW22_9HYME